MAVIQLMAVRVLETLSTPYRAICFWWSSRRDVAYVKCDVQQLHPATRQPPTSAGSKTTTTKKEATARKKKTPDE